MIKLEADKMTKAIERARAAHPKVRVISAADRIYSVTGRHGDSYTVRFVIANGHKLASCDCPARVLCYHIAAAASVNIAVQSMRAGKGSDKRQPVATSPATIVAPRIIRSVERDRTGVRVNVVRCDGWAV